MYKHMHVCSSFVPFLCMYISPCMCACPNMHVHVETRGQCQVSSSIALHLICLIRSQTVFTVARLAGRPGILLLSPPWCWEACATMPGFVTCKLRRIQLRSSHLHGKHLPSICPSPSVQMVVQKGRTGQSHCELTPQDKAYAALSL